MDAVSLRSHAGGRRGIGSGRRGQGDSARGGAEIFGSLRLLRVFGAVLREADVPGQAAHCRHRLELVDDVPRDEVNVVVAELRVNVTNTFPPQLVKLGIIHPLNTLDTHTQNGHSH